VRAARLTLVALAVAAGAPRRAEAQGERASARPVDRIVAIVGSKPILASQVEEQLVLAQAQGLKMPTDSAGRDAVRRQVLSQMVDEELIVQQAERDTTIKVTDQEVQDQVEQTVQNVRKQFGSTADFQAQLRAAQFLSEEEWRRWLADQQRRAILQQRLLDQLRQKGKLRPIPPTDAQLRQFSAAAARPAAPEGEAATHPTDRRPVATVLGGEQNAPAQTAGSDLVSADRDRAAARFRGQGAGASAGGVAGRGAAPRCKVC